mgnify:CR=1 FL=1
MSIHTYHGYGAVTTSSMPEANGSPVFIVRPWRDELRRRQLHDGGGREPHRSPVSRDSPTTWGAGAKLHGQRTHWRPGRHALTPTYIKSGCDRLLVRSAAGAAHLVGNAQIPRTSSA